MQQTIGQRERGIFHPPTSSNTVGTFNNFGGNPPANFCWQVIVARIPDTGSTVLMLMLGCGGLVLLQRRTQRSLN